MENDDFMSFLHVIKTAPTSEKERFASPRISTLLPCGRNFNQFSTSPSALLNPSEESAVSDVRDAYAFLHRLTRRDGMCADLLATSEMSPDIHILLNVLHTGEDLECELSDGSVMETGMICWKARAGGAVPMHSVHKTLHRTRLRHMQCIL
jgi:hypothetical protein